MKLGKYDSYKESGIDWLPQIPVNWQINRLKDVTETRSGTTPSSSGKFYYEKGKHNWARTTDLNNGELYETEFKVSDLAIDECRLIFFPSDTLLVAMYGGFGTIGKNSILKHISTINQSVCAILPSKEFNSLYLFYFLKYFRHSWRIFADGTRKDPNINQDAVRNLFYISPPIAEQSQIAQYLDQKTRAIDQKIELLKQKIARYKELKKSLINETVCRGLDKTVKFKDSGIEWIGKIPEHWEVKRLKDAFCTQTGNSISDKSKYEAIKNGMPYISTKDIDLNTGEINYDNGLYIPLGEKSFKVSKINSVLLCLEGGSAGRKVAYSNRNIGFVNKLVSLHPLDNKALSKFLYYQIQSLFFQRHFFSLMNGLIGGVSQNQLQLISLIIPTVDEQVETIEFLDSKTQIIDQTVANLNTQIDRLKELRTTLINDAVTGKIKVTP